MADSHDFSGNQCNLYDFLSRCVGMTVLHPGGLKATQLLAELCLIKENSKVLDLACGKGTSAVYLAKKYGCQVVGLDIDSKMIETGKKLARLHGVQDKVSFLPGDALSIPFADQEFDLVIAQSMLILIQEQKRVIAEALRVTRVGGFCGWVEFSWKKEPTPEFLHAVENEINAPFMLNAYTYDRWKELFAAAGAKKLRVLERSIKIRGIKSMLKAESRINALKIMLKYYTQGAVRERMDLLLQTYEKYGDIFAYGIYAVQKTAP